MMRGYLLEAGQLPASLLTLVDVLPNEILQEPGLLFQIGGREIMNGSLRWTPDGKAVIVPASEPGKGEGLIRIDVQTGQVTTLLPLPALGGWPRQAAQAYLAEAEPFERGWYAAPVGWVDPWGNGIFAVAIRSGIINNQSATLFAGAGIVADSNPANEWYETGLKFKPMVEALGGALPNG